jgi:hypothetical protein
LNAPAAFLGHPSQKFGRLRLVPKRAVSISHASEGEGAMVVPIQEFAFVTVGSVVLSLLLLTALWPWTREVRRLVIIASASVVGIVIWNVALNVTNAAALNVDKYILGLSAQDIGSAVAAFTVVLLTLVVAERGQPTSRVLGPSAIVGLVTLMVDRFG